MEDYISHGDVMEDHRAIECLNWLRWRKESREECRKWLKSGEELSREISRVRSGGINQGN